MVPQGSQYAGTRKKFPLLAGHSIYSLAAFLQCPLKQPGLIWDSALSSAMTWSKKLSKHSNEPERRTAAAVCKVVVPSIHPHFAAAFQSSLCSRGWDAVPVAAPWHPAPPHSASGTSAKSCRAAGTAQWSKRQPSACSREETLFSLLFSCPLKNIFL